MLFVVSNFKQKKICSCVCYIIKFIAAVSLVCRVGLVNRWISKQNWLITIF